MLPMNFRNLAPLAGMVVIIFAGCVAAPLLESRSAIVPAGIDLTGNWQIRKDAHAMHLPVPGASQRILVPKKQSSRHAEHRKGSGVSAQLFLEFGESLKITQTDFSIFISYDRSVVEEYTFGENRLVTVGPIEAQRVSGWDGSAFVVATLDDDGTILNESWHLESDDSVLVRSIKMNKGAKEKFSLRQVFDRK